MSRLWDKGKPLDEQVLAYTAGEDALFDIYRPKAGAEHAAGMAAGEKSLAVRLVLGSEGETLTDERIDAAVKAVVEGLQGDLGARLRG